jgi:hypothetical protein
MKTKLTFDESCTPLDRDQLVDKGEYPFFDGDGKHRDIPCVHCDRFTALTEKVGNNKTIGILGMAKNGSGLITAYSASEIREISETLVRMADYIDKENGR